MRRHHIYLAVLTAIAVSTVLTMASLSNQGNRVKPTSSDMQQAAKSDGDEWPVAAIDNLRQVDEEQRARREAKSRRYDKSLFGVKGAVKSAREDFTVILTGDREVDIPPLPVSQSSVILIGTVLDAKGFVSTDQTGVYSEFSTRVDEVLKTDEAAARLKPGDVIAVQRRGGRVQGQSARVLFRIRGQNMPRQGGNYVMFLGRLDGGEDYMVITGYELRAGKVFQLDSPDKFALYTEMDMATFSDALRGAIGQP